MEAKSMSIGIWVILGVVIVLKLCKVIEWSWVWVLAPFWISLLLSLILLIAALIIALRRL